MYHQSINFNMPAKDYENIKNLAHETRNTISGLLREGAELVLEKHNAAGSERKTKGLNTEVKNVNK